MCSTHDFEHLMADRSAGTLVPDEDFGLMTDQEVADHLAWRETVRAEYLPERQAERARSRAMAGLPRVADALAFARSLSFDAGARVTCQRSSFDRLWCIVHHEDFADGAGACESAR